MNCLICNSPFRTDIERRLKEKQTVKEIYDKFKLLLNYPSPFPSFRILIYRHKLHSKDFMDEKKQEEALEKLKSVDMESLVGKLALLASEKMGSMSAEKLKLSEVFAGQRILLEMKKLKMQEDSMSTAMKELFGPIIGKEEDGRDTNAQVDESQSQNSQQPLEVRGVDTGTPVSQGTSEVGTELNQENQHPSSGQPVGEVDDRSSQARVASDVQAQP